MTDPTQSKTSASILPDYSTPSTTKGKPVAQTTTTPLVTEISSETPSKPPTAPTPEPSTLTSTNTPTSTEPPTKKNETPEREKVPLEKKNSRLYKIGIILLLVILAGTTSIFYIRTKIKTVSTNIDTELEINPSPQQTIPSPTPKIVTLDKSEITLEVLNGTSKSGLAGKTADKFEELGYKIEKTGNADETKSNQLYVKTEFANQLTNLLDDVENELEITEITKEVDDLDTTAKIILGGE